MHWLHSKQYRLVASGLPRDTVCSVPLLPRVSHGTCRSFVLYCDSGSWNRLGPVVAGASPSSFCTFARTLSWHSM